MKLRSFILINCIVLFLILLADGIWLLKVEGIASVPKIYNKSRSDELTRLEEMEQEDTQKPVNILVMGLDEEGKRSDVILLLNFSPQYGKLNILSIARDTRIKVNNRNVKINSLMAIKGEELMVEGVEKLIDLPVHYYVTLNFEGFRKIVDALDGVEIDIPFAMNYDDPEQNLHIHLKKGKQLLDGEKAEQYVRYRKGNRPGDGYTFGDIGRIKAQQQFIKALIDQKMKIKYLSKADDIFLILKRYVKTNIEIGDINFYLKSLMSTRLEQVESYLLPGDTAYIGNVWYFLYDEKKTKELISEHFFR